VQATLELLERAPVLYLRQNDEERARLLHTLLLNCRVSGETLDPVYKKPFDLVEVGLKTGNWYARRDSNLDLRWRWPTPHVGCLLPSSIQASRTAVHSGSDPSEMPSAG